MHLNTLEFTNVCIYTTNLKKKKKKKGQELGGEEEPGKKRHLHNI